MNEGDFLKGAYYAVREEFNQTPTPGHIDKKWDALIRESIAHLDSLYDPDGDGVELPISFIEFNDLIECAHRRGITMRGEKPFVMQRHLFELPSKARRK